MERGCTLSGDFCSDVTSMDQAGNSWLDTGTATAVAYMAGVPSKGENKSVSLSRRLGFDTLAVSILENFLIATSVSASLFGLFVQQVQSFPTCNSDGDCKACNAQPCPVDCQWGQWTDFDACTTTCGGGGADVLCIRRYER